MGILGKKGLFGTGSILGGGGIVTPSNQDFRVNFINDSSLGLNLSVVRNLAVNFENEQELEADVIDFKSLSVNFENEQELTAELDEGFVYLVDELSVTPNFAWSVFQLNSTVTNCVRIRRSSDNSEQDFGFVNEYLDTSGISTFIGGGTGFVVTFYDASGNANNATESTAINQEPIALTGGVDNRAYINDSGSTYNTLHYALSSTITDTQECTYYTVVDKFTASNNGYAFSAATPIYGRMSYDGSGLIFRDGGGFLSYSGIFTTGNDYLCKIRRDSSDDIFMGVDNTESNRGTKSDLLNITHLRGSRGGSSGDSLLMRLPSDVSSADNTLVVDWYNTNFNKSI